LRNSPSCWLILYEYITMHGPQNVKEFLDDSDVLWYFSMLTCKLLQTFRSCASWIV